jgi:hypothetical protein
MIRFIIQQLLPQQAGEVLVTLAKLLRSNSTVIATESLRDGGEGPYDEGYSPHKCPPLRRGLINGNYSDITSHLLSQVY